MGQPPGPRNLWPLEQVFHPPRFDPIMACLLRISRMERPDRVFHPAPAFKIGCGPEDARNQRPAAHFTALSNTAPPEADRPAPVPSVRNNSTRRAGAVRPAMAAPLS